MARIAWIAAANLPHPVRAKLVSQPEDYPWSSASAHLSGRDDMFVKVAPLLEMVDDWGVLQ